MKVQAMPINRSSLLRKEALTRNIASVATAVEVLEGILIRKGVLENGQLMKEIEEFLARRGRTDQHMEGDDD